MMECAFCQVINHEVASNILFEDDQVVAIRDINPQAPVHLLIVSKRHIDAPSKLTENDAPLVGHMVAVANQLAREKGVDQKGYRLVMNCGLNAGQTVPHLHIHLLGGRQLTSLG
ncbi:MAG: histidine triad nucleotide-binding protein [Dehalococcoidia bacterium]